MTSGILILNEGISVCNFEKENRAEISLGAITN